jgi:hypothetical protein
VGFLREEIMDDEDDIERKFERKAVRWSEKTEDMINQMLEDGWDLMIVAPSKITDTAFCLLERELPDD